jgi:hypothetical protein
MIAKNFRIERDGDYNRVHIFKDSPGKFSICVSDSDLKELQKTIKCYRISRKVKS